MILATVSSGLLGLLGAATPLQRGTWVELPLPAVATGGAPRSTELLEPRGVHVHLRRPDDAGFEPGRPLLPAESVVQLLEQRARSAGADLRFLPGAPPLLASGSDEALGTARALLAELDAAWVATEFDLEVCWAAADAGPCDGTPREGHRHVRGTHRPAETIELGERLRTPFLSGYDVDVAADSGVASPLVGEVVTGKTLTLEVLALSDGGWLVRGLLDVAELEGIVDFPTEAPDLGLVQEPTVAAVQAAFSGCVRSGEALELAVRGAPLRRGDLRVQVRVVGRDAPAERSPRLFDLAFLTTPAPRLPGFPLADDEYFVGAASDPPFAAVPPRAITSLVGEPAGSSFSRSPAAEAFASNRAVLVLDGADPTAERVHELILAHERGRLAAGRVALRHGDLSVELPTTAFTPCRVVVGRETTRVRGYRAEIAPESWMPAPLVERRFEGLVLDAVAGGAGLRCGAVAVAPGAESELGRREASLGRVQLRARHQVRGARLVPTGAAGAELWVSGEALPALHVDFSEP